MFLASGDGKFLRRSFDRGAEDYLRALMLADQARDSSLAVRSALRLAMAFEGTGRLRDALTNYGECLKRSDRTRGAGAIRLEALIRVGNLYLRGRQFNEAVRFFRAALASAVRKWFFCVGETSWGRPPRLQTTASSQGRSGRRHASLENVLHPSGYDQTIFASRARFLAPEPFAAAIPTHTENWTRSRTRKSTVSPKTPLPGPTTA